MQLVAPPPYPQRGDTRRHRQDGCSTAAPEEDMQLETPIFFQNFTFGSQFFFQIRSVLDQDIANFGFEIIFKFEITLCVREIWTK